MTDKRHWTFEQLALLKAHYPDMRTADLVEILGRKLPSIYNMAFKLKLNKSAAFLASPASGRTNGRQGFGSRFVKGQEAWNKGTHFKAGGRSAETQFKKGVRQGVAVKLYQPIGSERLSKDDYLQRKVNDDLPLQGRWRGVHIINWESVNGKLPKGHAIVFRDGNKKNCAIENLELVTRAELMRRNSYHNNYPKEIAQLIQLKGAVQRKINRREKNERSIAK